MSSQTSLNTSENLELYRQLRNKFDNVIYKNILAEKEDAFNETCEKKLTKIIDNCAENTSKNTSTNNLDDIWQIYQDYANDALNSLPKQTEMPKQQDLAINVCPTDAATNMSVVQSTNELVEQLNRMEEMLKEIYLCNKELYKSLLNYCSKYTNE